MVKNTSLEAIRTLRERKIIGERQEAVLNTIYKIYPCTDSEVMQYLDYHDRNMVSPRRNELMKKGLIHKVGERICRVTGYNAEVWQPQEETIHKILVNKQLPQNQRMMCQACNGKGWTT